MQFSTRIDRHGDVVAVWPSGDVDRDTAPQLREALLVAVTDAAGGGRVEVNLSGVPFLDSSGIGALLTARRDALDREIAFRVCDPQPDVRRVFEITNVWRLLAG